MYKRQVYGPASHGERGVIEVQTAFMNQPRRLANHRGNILNPVWTHVGIGVAYACLLYTSRCV